MTSVKSMFCEQCGTQVEDDMLYCQNCGAALKREAEQVSVEEEAKPEKVAVPKSLNLKEWTTYLQSLSQKAMLAVAGGTLAALILVLVLFDCGGYRGVVSSYFNAMKNAKAETIINLRYPEDIRKQYYEEYEELYDMDKKECLKYMEKILKSRMKDVDKLTWEIKTVENLNNLDKLEDEMEAIDVEDLDDFRDRMEEMFEDYDNFDARCISEAYAVKVKVTKVVDGDKDRTTAMDIIYKYKGKWYMTSGFSM